MYYKITAAVFACLSVGIWGIRAICISILFASSIQAGLNKDSTINVIAIFDDNTHLVGFAVSSFIIGLILFLIGFLGHKTVLKKI